MRIKLIDDYQFEFLKLAIKEFKNKSVLREYKADLEKILSELESKNNIVAFDEALQQCRYVEIPKRCEIQIVAILNTTLNIMSKNGKNVSEKCIDAIEYIKRQIV